jgi:hypothetical protein
MTTSMDDMLIAILVPLVNIWRRLRQRIFDSYRPELHYMRGPGPKWREKHGHAISTCRSRLSIGGTPIRAER